MAGSKHYPKQSEATWTSLSFGTIYDNTIVSGVAGMTITIVKLVLGTATGTTVTATLSDGSQSPPTCTSRGTFYLGVVPLVLDLEDDPIIIGPGDNFVINLSATV